MCEEIKDHFIWRQALEEFVIEMTPEEQAEIASVPDMEVYLNRKLCNVIRRWQAASLPHTRISIVDATSQEIVVETTQEIIDEPRQEA